MPNGTKNILIITAHPSAKNLTKGLAQIYKDEKESKGFTVKTVDLYEDKQLPYLRFEDAQYIEQSKEISYYQEQIIWADEIVIIYPFWWGSMPAILKNWVDSILTAGFAFQYGDNGRPYGLLQGRSVRIITTCGAPKFLYCLNGIHRANVNIWKKSIIKFCGMDFDGYHLFGGVDSSGKKVDKIFDAVKKMAQK